MIFVANMRYNIGKILEDNIIFAENRYLCLLYTSDAADEL